MDKRFFVPAEQSNTVVVTGPEHNHMVNVMRLKVGDIVVLCYGDGYDNHAEIKSIDKRSATLEVLSRELNLNEPTSAVTIFQALPKGDKLDLVVQKCVELGVGRIVPFVSKYVQTKRESVKLERLRRVALEAAKQCGRAKLLEIEEPVSIEDVVGRVQEYDWVIHPYEGAQEPSLQSVLRRELSGGCKDKCRNVAAVIGSEGGFEPQECEALQNAGAKQVTLGRRILRTETASIIISAILMYELGELKY